MTVTLEKSLVNRERLIEAVKAEIIGPSKYNEYAKMFNAEGNTILEQDELYHNYFWSRFGVKEEVLQVDFPSRRYSAGMLYPLKTKVEEVVQIDGLVPTENMKIETINENQDPSLELKTSADENNSTNANKSISNNDYLPSSLGITCRISKNTKKIKIIFNGAHYKPHKVMIKGKSYSKTWWLRETLIGEYILDLTKFPDNFIEEVKLPVYNLGKEEIKKLEISLDLRCRLIKNSKLITFTVTNRSTTKKAQAQADEMIIFQSEIVLSLFENDYFLNYPKHYQRNLPMTIDEQNDELLYRNKINYAFGHGCSTTWNQNTDSVSILKTTFLPTYETTSMTPDIETIQDGVLKPLKIRMIDLANAANYEELHSLLFPLVDGYRDWIEELEKELQTLPEALQEAAKRNIELCSESLNRIRNGLNLLKQENVQTAFRLANKAMLLQQVNGKTHRVPEIVDREIKYNIPFKDSVSVLEDLQESTNSWRAFQIAFFLMSLDSIVNDESTEREIVDLIWFPTGGGKTEAYLAVAAFQMFYRRILNPNDAGVDVIMRYTLRLLTADQFQRSSRLICAMEYLRRTEQIDLGSTPYSIGMWVGSNTSPNTHADSIAKLNSMNSGRNNDVFLVNRCPWCGSQLGNMKVKDKKISKKKTVLGYRNENGRLVTYCPDKSCHFNEELPVYFVDATIYEKQPTFLIGTIDKFVQLTRKPEARTLFGIDKNGEQLVTPPNLIIQDELHLISGPLGTLSGLFETVIEELCTKNINGKFIKPKIISATATIKEFEEQAKCLFGRTTAKLFPSPGLDIDDSFFAKVAVDENNMPLPGRKYVGIFTSNVGQMMAEVQTFSAILQEANQIPKEEVDPYWTLLAFYNSLKDLGAGINLCNMDIPTYMMSIRNREDYPENRFIKEPLELTSRMQSYEISQAIDNLKNELNPKKKQRPLDVCLASNIIEVGVDIDRLSVMAVVGQPKSTAQYIQVTGRVGRRWFERPGVIFTIYSNRNSRDKSHFEHFNEYHQRLYAQVETTSVTPFSDASLERGLCAVIISFLRQRFSALMANTPSPEELEKISKTTRFKNFVQSLISRVKLVDPEQQNAFKKVFEKVISLILSGDFNSWEVGNGVQGLFFTSGDPVAKNNNPLSIGLINSLRSVDAESKGKITTFITVNNKSENNKSSVFNWEDFI